MMKLKPIFVCASTILLALSLSACHQLTNQSTSQSTQTSSYESKAKSDNQKPKSVNPFQKNKEKPKNLPKMGEKITESSTSKAFSSAPIFGNPTKGIVNATVEQALQAPKGQEKEEEIEKPEYLTLEDIKKEEKPTVTPVATKPVENEQSPKPIEKPTIEEDEEESELPIEQPNTDNNETIEPPIVETVPVLTIEKPIIHINEGENVDVKDYVKVTDVQDALVELKVPLTELHVGENQITVTATNRFGNTATAILTVVVNAKPVMTLTQEEVELQLGDSFLPVDYVSVVDTEDGDLTDSLTITNPVDTKKAGTYEVIYEAKDSQGVTVSKSLIVHVIDPNAKDERTEKEEMTDKEISQVSDSDNSHEILEETESEVHNSEIPLDPSTFNEDSDVPVFYSKIS